MVHTLVKIIIGAILVIVAVWWVFWTPDFMKTVKETPFVATRTSLADLITILNGALPPLVALVGLLIVWLEWDSLRIEKELAAEEKKKK